MKILTIIFMLLSLIACKNSKRQTNVHQGHPEILFHFQRFFNETENDYSFPHFFNDQFLVKHRIKSITRKLYFPEKGDSNLLELKTYQFNPKGQPTSIRLTYFYEGLKIEDFLLNYEGEADPLGYHKPRIFKASDNKEIIDYTDLPFDIHTKKSTVIPTYFQHNEKRNYLFILHAKNKGLYAISRKYKPQKNDLIFYQSMDHLTKWHQIENKIIEKNSCHFTYEGNYFKGNLFKKEDYTKKRRVLYEGTQKMSIQDSIFLNQQFLYEEIRQFTYKNKFPIKMEFFNSNRVNPLIIEIYQYEIY